MMGSGVKFNMNNETTTEEAGSNPEGITEENWTELLKAVYHNGLVTLKMRFEQVEGQVSHWEACGPVFVYSVKDAANNEYFCGFFLQELIARYQAENNPAVWMASFFYELMKTEGGKPLPDPLTNEDEAKAIIDKILVPQCIEAVREEFAPEQVHAGLAWNQEHGPVFEAGFPAITEGNNVCAIPVQLLLIHYQLNRDPAELLIQGLYNLRKEHGMD